MHDPAMWKYLNEFLGTAILVLLGDGVVAGVLLKHSKAEGGGWVVITLAWGLAVLMGIYVAGAVSGALMNPALTIGLAIVGKLSWSLVPGFILAQMAGGFVGGVLVYLAYLPHWRPTQDPGLKLAVFCTGPAIRHLPSNFLTEVIGTFVLAFGVLAIGTNAMAPGVSSLAVALMVVVIGMSLGGPTGYAINPARDIGPRLAHWVLPIPGKGSSDWGYAVVPAFGPVVGAILGALGFHLIYG